MKIFIFIISLVFIIGAVGLAILYRLQDFDQDQNDE